eukprot:NODE_3694_length_743_cov_3.804035_g3102_i0.p2 GENE.NODE_3694_length_743_cov_3.804035_g3102_i0~~NODE_3694_length_743_cov_3.804035_g3102_i0.p2  ORF type:complete len:67 (+),score=6.74 NODE_3694_length_743_cov_3.804035_g3102_i0:93-293(+)
MVVPKAGDQIKMETVDTKKKDGGFKVETFGPDNSTFKKVEGDDAKFEMREANISMSEGYVSQEVKD